MKNQTKKTKMKMRVGKVDMMAKKIEEDVDEEEEEDEDEGEIGEE